MLETEPVGRIFDLKKNCPYEVHVSFHGARKSRVCMIPFFGKSRSHISHFFHMKAVIFI